MKKEIKLFMAYAPEDEDYQKELSKHLAGLKEDGIISEISAAEVLPGADIMNDLRKRMGQSDIIALLLSSDFLGTNHGVELEEMAFAQMAKKGTRLVPIKIREVTLGKTYAQFSMLPGQNKPVDDPEWGGRDAAYANITAGIRQLAESMKEDDNGGGKSDKPEPTPAPPISPAIPDKKNNMGMKIGIGAAAALAIAAAIWFMMPKSSAESNQNTTTTSIDNNDRDAYTAAKTKGTIEAYEGYLEAFSEGDYKTEANSNIERLKEEKYTADAAAEWQKAIASNNLTGYSYYLQNYPHGDSVEVAKTRIQELSTAADDTKAWETASGIGTQRSFLLYVQEYGDQGRHYTDAVEGIKGLLNPSGWSYYGAKKSDGTMQNDRYYDRLLGEKNAPPKEGDLIIVKKAIRVRTGPKSSYGVKTVLAPEALAEIMKVNDDYWVQIKY